MSAWGKFLLLLVFLSVNFQQQTQSGATSYQQYLPLLIHSNPLSGGYDPKVKGLELVGELSDEDLANLQELHPSWVRFHVNWYLVEKEPGVYNWESAEIRRIERILEEVGEMGTEPFLTVKMAPNFYRSKEELCARPDENDGELHLALFFKALAERYPQISYMELWNEPDAPWEATAPDVLYWGIFGCWAEPEHETIYESGLYYGNVLRLIKEHIPERVELVGGALLGDLEYMEGIAAGAGDALDVFSFHRFANYRSDEEEDSLYIEDMKAHYQEVQVRLPEIPIIISETSLLCRRNGEGPCTDYPEFYDRQAEYLTQLYRWVEEEPQLIAFIWYTMQPNSWRDSDLVYRDGTRKPAFDTFAKLP